MIPALSGDWVVTVTFDDELEDVPGGRWLATGLSTTHPDRNRITSFVYDHGGSG